MNHQQQTMNQNQQNQQAAQQPLTDQELAFDLLYQEKALLSPSLPVSEKLKVKKPNDSTRKRNNLKKSGRNLKLSLAFLLDLWYNCFVGI